PTRTAFVLFVFVLACCPPRCRPDLLSFPTRRSSDLRLVAEAFVENPHNKPFVNHLDGDKTNNRKDNLVWCTHIENMQHASLTGLDRKSTRLNSSHVKISYAVLCLNK